MQMQSGEFYIFEFAKIGFIKRDLAKDTRKSIHNRYSNKNKRDSPQLKQDQENFNEGPVIPQDFKTQGKKAILIEWNAFQEECISIHYDTNVITVNICFLVREARCYKNVLHLLL